MVFGYKFMLLLFGDKNPHSLNSKILNFVISQKTFKKESVKLVYHEKC